MGASGSKRGADALAWVGTARSAGPEDGPLEETPILSNAEVREFALPGENTVLPWYVYPAGTSVGDIVEGASGPDGKTAMDCSVFAQLVVTDLHRDPAKPTVLGVGGDITMIARALGVPAAAFPVYFGYRPAGDPVSYAYAQQFSPGGRGIWLVPMGANAEGAALYAGNEFGAHLCTLDGWFKVMTRDPDRVVYPDIRRGLRAPVDARENWRLDAAETSAAIAGQKRAEMRSVVSQRCISAGGTVVIWKPNGDGRRAWFVEGAGETSYGDEADLRDFLRGMGARCAGAHSRPAVSSA